MDITMFFEFPGILILIGVVLLLVSIIIGLVAYRKVDKEDLVFTIDENETIREEEPIIEVTQKEAVVEEAPIEQEEKQEPKAIEEPETNNEYIELNEVEEVKVETLPVIETKEVIEEKEIKTTIYGGNNPKQQFVFDEKEKTIYGQKQQVTKQEEDIEEVEVL